MAEIRHHGEPEHIDPEDAREKLEPTTDPESSMFVVMAPSEDPFRTETLSPTPIHTVHHLSFAARQLFPPIHPRHDFGAPQ